MDLNIEEIKVLIDEKTLQDREQEIASEIERDYKGKAITFICVLKGSTFFTVDLAKKINSDVNIEFIRLSSYGSSTESSGKIKMMLDLQESIEGKDVIIIEDITDTGRTLKYLIDHLNTKKPNSIKICALLNKKERKVFDIPIDYLGFEIPNKFVVGYGLDYDEKYRNLPYVGYFENV